MRALLLAAALMAIGFGAASSGAAGQEPERRAAGYSVSLRLPADGLVAKEEMEIEFRLEDVREKAGPQPVRFARIRATVDMPSMPSMPAFDEIAHQEDVPGEYGAHPTFAHGGEYRLTLTMLPASEQPLTISPRNPLPFSLQFVLQVADARNPSTATARRPVKRFGLLVTPLESVRAGVPVDLNVAVLNHSTRLTRPDGSFQVGDGPVPEFDTVHEKLIHLFIVRDDLGVFAHEHPEPAGPGVFRLRYTFPTAGRYRLFADVAPRRAGSQILMDEIIIEGVRPARFDLAHALGVQSSPPVESIAGLEVEWHWPQPPPAQRSVIVSARLRTAAGGVVSDLEPYLGAMGHLMFVHEDGVTFVHCHPDEREPATPGATVVPFLARFPKPGLYRGWGQFQRAGRVLTVDFVVRAGE